MDSHHPVEFRGEAYHCGHFLARSSYRANPMGDAGRLCFGMIFDLGCPINWLQVLGAAELTQIHQRVRHQLHAIVPLLDAFKS